MSKILEIEFKVGENVQVRVHGGKVIVGQIQTINRNKNEYNVMFMDGEKTTSKNFIQGDGCKITHIK